jgi:hypothetical protein
MDSARKGLERALAIDPNHAYALGALGGYCAIQGQMPEALTALDRAMRVSPHDPLTSSFMFWRIVLTLTRLTQFCPQGGKSANPIDLAGTLVSLGEL